MSSLLIEATELEAILDSPTTRVVDLSRHEVHRQYHIPGACLVDYAEIAVSRPPVHGLLPNAAALARLAGRMALTPETHVIAYDDEGGGKAARLLWTLDAMGHHNWSLLNGGLHAWANEGHPMVAGDAPCSASAEVAIDLDSTPLADADYIRQRLHGDLKLLDARTAEEYRGVKRYANQAGHIPGAVNFDWMNAIDQDRNLRLRDRDTLLAALATLGIGTDDEVVVYCQTHHRSSHSYVLLKYLGFAKVRGYPGSWSDWGNRMDLPVATQDPDGGMPG